MDLPYARSSCPSSKKRRRIGDDLFTYSPAADAATAHRQLHARAPPLAIEPCSIKHIEDHISLVRTEIEEYEDLITMKKAEISHAELRIEYLKSITTCNTYISTSGSNMVVSKEHLIKTFTDSIKSNICLEEDSSKLEQMKNDFVKKIESSSSSSTSVNSNLTGESKKQEVEGDENKMNSDPEFDDGEDSDGDEGMDQNSTQAHPNLHEVQEVAKTNGGDSRQHSIANKQMCKTKDANIRTYMAHVLRKRIPKGYVPAQAEISMLLNSANVIDFFESKKIDGLLQGSAKGYKASISQFYRSHFPKTEKKWDNVKNTGNIAFHPTVLDIVKSLPMKKEKKEKKR